MIRVVHVIDSGGMYGAERVVIELMIALRDLGLDVTLASISEPGRPEKLIEIEAKALGFDVLRKEFNVGYDRRSARELLRDICERKFDLVHTHGYKANALISGMSRRNRRIPAIATLHGWTAAKRFSRMGVYESVERFLLRRADRVVAVSHTMLDKWHLSFHYGNSVSVISNGIIPAAEKTELAFELLRAVDEFAAGRKLVLAVGRMAPEKGFDLLLRAIAIMRKDQPNICVLLVGDGGKRTELATLTRELGISDSVMMPGYIDGVTSLIKRCDVLAIPSRTEGLPIILLEGLMCGAPIVATCVGDIPMVLTRVSGDDCIKPNDPIELATALTRKINDGVDRRKSQVIIGRATRYFSSERMANQYLHVYTSLIREAGMS